MSERLHMKKEVFNYYLCYLDENAVTYDDLSEVYDRRNTIYTSITPKELANLGIRFLTDIPSENSINYSHKFTSDITSYDTLSELIEDFILSYDIEDCSDVSDDDEQILANFDILKNKFLIFKYHLKDKKLTLVDLAEIDNSYDDAISDFINFKDSEDIDFSEIIKEKYPNVQTVFNEFIEIVQKLTRNDYSYLVATSEFNNSEPYSICVMRDGGILFNKFITECPAYDGVATEYGLHFENSIETLFMYFSMAFLTDSVIGVVLSTHQSSPETEFDESFFKKYGFAFVPIPASGRVDMIRMTAKDVKECFTYDSTVMMDVKPSVKEIYCGYDDSDYICGFDLI